MQRIKANGATAVSRRNTHREDEYQCTFSREQLIAGIAAVVQVLGGAILGIFANEKTEQQDPRAIQYVLGSLFFIVAGILTPLVGLKLRGTDLVNRKIKGNSPAILR